MILSITRKKTLQQLQDEFHERYPFLKIEFYKTGSHNKTTSQRIVLTSIEIGKIYPLMKEGNVSIAETASVNEVEESFKRECNLPVQVLRKSGNLWMETSVTNQWTLKQQNSHGSEVFQSRDDIFKTFSCDYIVTDWFFLESDKDKK